MINLSEWVEPTTSWSSVRHASDWATKAGQFQRGITAKMNWQELQSLWSAHLLTMLYISMKFCENILKWPSSVCLSICLSITLSCLLHISWTLWMIFIKFWSNVCLCETMCRTNYLTMPTQGQGHNWRSLVWPSNFMFIPYLSYPWKDFHFSFRQMCASVRPCAEPITQPCLLKVNVTTEDHKIEPWSLYPLHISFTPIRISFNFGKMFTSVRQCAETIT